MAVAAPNRSSAWPRPTRRGVALLAGGGVLLLSGMLLERRDAIFIGFFLLLVPLVAMGYIFVRRTRVHVSRTFSPQIVAAGSDSVVAVVVQNLSQRPSYGARWVDQAEKGIQLPESALLPALGRHGSFDAGDTAHIEYTLTPRRRGVYTIGPLLVLRSDPFGLAVGRQPAGEPHDLVVTPRVTTLPGNALGLSSSDGFMHELLRSTNPNADELIAREYRPGDPLRRMNWPATARHGELMVRQEEQRSNPEARLIIDTAASGAPAAGSSSSDRRGRTQRAFETALEMAASVGMHLLEAGFRLDVVETGPSQLSPAPDRRRGGLRGDTPTAYQVPAGDRELLEGLANLELPERRIERGGDQDSPGSVLRGTTLRLPTFAVLVDVDERDARELNALRPYCEPAVAFVCETVPSKMVDKLEDGGWHCVALASPRSIPQAWLQADRRRSEANEPR